MTASAQEARDGNLTSASLAAVAMATTAVDAALLNVEQAVGKAGQNKQARLCDPRDGRDGGSTRCSGASLLPTHRGCLLTCIISCVHHSGCFNLRNRQRHFAPDLPGCSRCAPVVSCPEEVRI